MTVLGRYTLESELGRGAMGVVHRGLDEALDRPVAIKILEPASGPISNEQRERFRREARVAASLHHPNVVTVYELLEDAGRLAIVMELLEGRPLDDLLRRERRLPMRVALSLAQQLLEGLAAAHDAGLVHRDIKPANLIVDAAWRLKIVDFGIAKLASEALTAHGVMFGTFGYVAPELFRGQAADQRSDLFAVGCLVYEMVTGLAAFTGDSLAAISHATLFSEPGFDPSLWLEGPGLQDLARCLLRKEPHERPACARDALALLAGSASFPASPIGPLVRPDSSGGMPAESLVLRAETVRSTGSTVLYQTQPSLEESVAPPEVVLRSRLAARTPMLAIGLLVALLVFGVVGSVLLGPSRTESRTEGSARGGTGEASLSLDSASASFPDSSSVDSSAVLVASGSALTSSSEVVSNQARGAATTREAAGQDAERPTVDVDSLSLFVGDERRVHITGAGTEPVSWRSELSAVATVDAGVVAAINPGRTEILIDVGKATLRVPVVVRRPESTVSATPTWEQLDAAVADAVVRRDRQALARALALGGSASSAIPGTTSVIVEAARAGDVGLVTQLLRCGAPSRGPVIDSALRFVTDEQSAVFKALAGAKNGEGVGIQDCGERIRNRRPRAPRPL